MVTQKDVDELETQLVRAKLQLWEEQRTIFGPETEVWVSHTLIFTKKMTLGDLAASLECGVHDLVDDNSIKNARNTVSRLAPDNFMIDNDDIDDEAWSVLEI